jgi:hypothetical protein
MEPDDLLEPGQARAPVPPPARFQASATAAVPAAPVKPGLSVRLEGLRAFYGEAGTAAVALAWNLAGGGTGARA